MKLRALIPAIQARIAAGEQASILAWLLEVTRLPALESYKNTVIQLSAQWEEYQREKRQGTTADEVLRQRRNQIRQALLELTDEMEDNFPDVEVPPLPEPAPVPAETGDSPKPTSYRIKGIREAKLRGHVMVLLLAIKLGLIVFLYILWDSGSNFSTEQFIGTIAMIVPLFAAWLGVMFDDWLGKRNLEEDDSPYVSRKFQMTVYVVLAGYGLIFFSILNLKGPGIITHEQMNALLATLEVGLGVYIGKLVKALANG
ncbi:MAG: hypothetical protein R3D00_07790 [Bacteroidia bacterium]